jgi:hypothetical protein
MKKFNCDVCDFSTHNKTNFKYHLDSKKHKIAIGLETKKDEVIIHQCNQCEYNSDRTYNLKLHIENIHDNQKIRCDYCNKYYKDQDEYDNHLILDSHELKIVKSITIHSGKMNKILKDYNDIKIKKQKENEPLDPDLFNIFKTNYHIQKDILREHYKHLKEHQDKKFIE